MKKIVSFAALLLSIVFASSCAKESSMEAGGRKLAAPEIKIAALGTTSFSIKWSRVEGAANYEYEFADTKATTDTTVLTLNDLLEDTEYTLVLRAIPREGSADTQSEPAYINVITSKVSPLPSPVITLGCAYASKTVINWSSVGGAKGYSYTLGSQRGTTKETRLEFGNLKAGTDYTFTVKALTDDATLSNDSVESSLEFTTETEDIPAIIIAPSGTGADYVTFEVLAMPEMTYVEDMIPTTTLLSWSEDAIIEIYHDAIVENARLQNVSFPLAMASALNAGSRTFKTGGLVSQLSYSIIAFGMDVKGNVTTGLYTKTVKTESTGYSDGPNFGSCSWFSQEVYLDKNYAATLGLDLTNSFFTRWKGDNVVSVKYRAFDTATFLKAFPTLDEDAIKEILNTTGYSTSLGEGLIDMVNDRDGLMKVTQCSAATSYTVAALAKNASGEEALLVNSIGTKSIATERTWFVVSLGVNENYPPTSEKIVASFKGSNIESLKYGLFQTDNITEIPVSKYDRLVEVYGRELGEDQIPYVNGGGFGIIFTGEPNTSYTLIATATNSVGDKITKYYVGSTTAATPTTTTPTASTLGRKSLRGVDEIHYGVFDVIPGMEGKTVDAKKLPYSEDEIWRKIHNQKLLEK